MAVRSKILDGVKKVMTERAFTEKQINKVIPKLHENYFHEPRALGRIIDTWNVLMNTSSTIGIQPDKEDEQDHMPPLAKPPINSLFAKNNPKVDMTTILADVEPELLLLEPSKLIVRHTKVCGLNFANNTGELWSILYYAPRGFYLQNYTDLLKKTYYVEQNLINFLYDKKQQKEMKVHPIVKSAKVLEYDFDHLRTRYLFALRCGYKSLSHMYTIKMALELPTLSDLVCSTNEEFLKKFAPFCSMEEYQAFSKLINEHELDQEDAEIFEKLAELNGSKGIVQNMSKDLIDGI